MGTFSSSFILIISYSFNFSVLLQVVTIRIKQPNYGYIEKMPARRVGSAPLRVHSYSLK